MIQLYRAGVIPCPVITVGLNKLVEVVSPKQSINYIAHKMPAVERGVKIKMENRFLLFSAEAQTPSGPIIMGIVYPIAQQFNKLYGEKYFSKELNDIFIVFICTSDEFQSQGFYKERNYISHKNKYADMRLHLKYDEFVKADDDKRKAMICDVILRAFDNIRRKKALACIDEVEKDLEKVFWNYVGSRGNSL